MQSGQWHSVVELSIAELEQYSHFVQWVDVHSGRLVIAWKCVSAVNCPDMIEMMKKYQ